MKILIAEDELTTLNGITKLIERFGENYEVVGTARNGIHALEYIQNHPVDILLTDIRMPDMDGISLIRDLKQQNFTGEIIILSGYSDFEYTREALRLKIFDYLLKPITKDALKTCLDNAYLALSRKQSENDPYLFLLQSFRQFSISGYTDSRAKEKFLNYLSKFSKYQAVCAIICTGAPISEKEHLPLLQQAMEQVTARLSNPFVLLCPGKDKNYLSLLLLSEVAADWRSLFTEYVKYLTSISYPNSFLFYEPSSDLTGVPELFQTLYKFSNYCIILTPGSAVTSSYLLSIPLQSFTYPKTVEESILQAISKRDIEKATFHIHDFIMALTRKTYSPRNIYDAMVKLISSILFLIKSENYSLYSSINQISLINCVEQCTSIQEFEQIALNIVNHLNLEQSATAKSEYSNLTESTIHYIKTRFDTDLSLEWIAEKLGVTTEHLSRRFSNEVGKNFITYLTEYRIEMAKQYLTDGKHKIYEAAAMVGFTDSKYFSRVFKKYTGKTPGYFLKK